MARTSSGVTRSLSRADTTSLLHSIHPLVDDLCSLVSQRLRQTLEDKLELFRA